MKKYLSLSISIFFICLSLHGQRPDIKSSGEIYQSLEKFNILGSALYIAAHPDDENTRLISLLSNDTKARTAYLSLTRGDGGQNRIGTDIREKLGLIRTHELLEARKIDGGQQFFSRANDFGYSKSPEETLTIWNKDEVLHDMIKVIREFRPDVIINRFDHRDTRVTHGHHTSSAILSLEAFDMANEPGVLGGQLDNLPGWQPQRLFFNTGWWFFGSRENFENADKSHMISIDAGVYYPILGESNTEIAARSRSMHKSQGFGSTGTRGKQMEYLELIKGEMPPDETDLFSGINTSWSRVQGGDEIGMKVKDILSSFNFQDPSVHVPEMLEIFRDLNQLEDSFWRSIKIEELKEIIVASCGLFLEASTSELYGTRGEAITVLLESTNRSSYPVFLESAHIQKSTGELKMIEEDLPPNEAKIYEMALMIEEDAPLSNPYWLSKEGTLGMYRVTDKEFIGAPDAGAAVEVEIKLQFDDISFTVSRDVVHKSNDPVEGAVYQPFYILPAASVSFASPVLIFSDRQPKEVEVDIKAYKEGLTGSISLVHPKSWIVSPSAHIINLEERGSVKHITFTVKGPVLQESGTFGIRFIDQDGNVYEQSVDEIQYDHIPHQLIISPARARVERINLIKKGENIAYIPGAGDDIPQSLRQIGYKVDELDVTDIKAELLAKYDATIIGIRAYNTKPEIKLKHGELMSYVNNGGTLIVQYNTSRDIASDDLGPYMIKLSRERVTDENAVVSLEDPDHDVLNFPNQITTRDFQGWVQERGLYFANEWDSHYQAPLACSDYGESLKRGGLLITPYGKGHYIFTAYSWFRQLPAGVPGAYRLFTNLISMGKNKEGATESNSNE